MRSSWHLPLRSLHGLIFLLVAVIFFSIALVFRILPLLLLSAFMIALVVIVILLLLILYPFILIQFKSLKFLLIHNPDHLEKKLKLSFPSKLHNFILFMYNAQLIWQDSIGQSLYHNYPLTFDKEQIITLHTPSRGVYRIHPCVQFMDIFGLFSIEFTLSSIKEIIIPANPVTIFHSGDLILEKVEKQNQLFFMHKNNIASKEFYDFKPYVRGDDIRSIDWHLYARFHELYIKNHRSNTLNKPEGYHFHLILPTKDEDLEIIIEFTQRLCYTLQQVYHKKSQLHINKDFNIKHFDGNSFENRKKLAYISSNMKHDTHVDSRSIFIAFYHEYSILKQDLHLTTNSGIVLVHAGKIYHKVSLEEHHGVHFVSY